MIESPCEDICVLDENMVCIGCKRTREEILKWLVYSDEEKLAVIENCKKRKIEGNYDHYI